MKSAIYKNRLICLVSMVGVLCAPLTFAAAAPKEITTQTGVKMLLLPGGTFTMGDANGEIDETPHKVTVSPFYMDVYEVTQINYMRLMDDNPSRKKGKMNPVEQIRWSDAVKYCNARSKAEGLEQAYDLEEWTCNFEANGYRLPTEAQWEYAARGGTTTSYSFGATDKNIKQFAWFRDKVSGKPHPVGQRKPNPFGLHDMHGNLWEWCNDFYGVEYYGNSPEKDPRGPESGEKKVLRGGSFGSSANSCRSAYRNNEDPAYTDACFGYDIYGFRCVRNADK